MLTEEEKKGLEEMKDETHATDSSEDTMRAFANQLTQVKQDLHHNRTVVASLFKEVEEFHEAHSKIIKNEE